MCWEVANYISGDRGVGQGQAAGGSGLISDHADNFKVWGNLFNYSDCKSKFCTMKKENIAFLVNLLVD